MTQQTVGVVIVAAGRGRRLGGEIPKQYLVLGDRAVVAHALDAFLSTDNVNAIAVVIHPDDRALYDAATGAIADPRLLPPVMGGATRAASVQAGLAALKATAPDLVLIHDAARPFVSADIIARVCAALATHDGACAALPVVDAVWHTAPGAAPRPVARDGLWRAQTPQGFRFGAIRDAHRQADPDALDDVAVAVAAGLSVTFVEGDAANYKITTQADLARATRDIAARSA